jgi:hypothetical protein
MVNSSDKQKSYKLLVDKIFHLLPNSLFKLSTISQIDAQVLFYNNIVKLFQHIIIHHQVQQVPEHIDFVPLNVHNHRLSHVLSKHPKLYPKMVQVAKIFIHSIVDNQVVSELQPVKYQL